MPAFDPARLYSALLNSGLQQKDPALYQVIYQLIGAVLGINRSVNTNTGSGGSGSTIINPITLLGIIGDSGADGESSFLPGATGPIGPTGAAGPAGANGTVGYTIYPENGQDGESAFIPGPQGIPGEGLTPGFASVYRSINQVIPDSTETLISWDTVIYDDDSCFSLGDPTKLTIQVAGTYAVCAQLNLEAFAGTGEVFIKIYQNGVEVARNATNGAGLATLNPSIQVDCQIECSIADELEIALEIIESGAIDHDVIGGIITSFSIGTLGAVSGSGGGSSGSSGLVLLEEHIASASADLTFGTRNVTGQSGALFQSDFDDYMIELVGLLPVSNGVNTRLRFSTDGGATYDSGANYAQTFTWQSTTGANNASGASGNTYADMGGDVSSSATGGIYGSYRLKLPSSSTAHKTLVGDSSFLHTSIGRMGWFRSLHYLIATPVTNFQVEMILAAGGTPVNIASGTMRVYGIAKA